MYSAWKYFFYGQGFADSNRWHGTILAKLALIPQNLLNSYVSGPANPKDGKYSDGDLVANFPGCDKKERGCADEMRPFFGILAEKGSGSG